MSVISRDITEKERQYLKYQPDIGFVPKILSKVESDSRYEVPPALQALVDVLPSSLLEEVGNLIRDAEVLGKRMEKCLQDDVGDGVPFKSYQEEKNKNADADYDLIDKYESYHAKDVKGSIQAEVYPILLDMKDELTEYRDFLNKQFYNNNADYENLDTIKNKEKADIEKSIGDDMEGKLPSSKYKKLEVTAQLSRYALNRIENTKNFIKDLNGVLCYNTNQYYNGHIRDIVQSLGEAPVEVLKDLNKMNEVKFRQSVDKFEQDKNRSSKYNTKEIKHGMNSVMQKVSTMKTSASDNVLDWLQTIDTNFDQSPVTMIMTDALDNIEFVQEEYDKTLLELFKHNKLDEMLKNDQISSLLEKKQSRQRFNLISDIVTEKENKTFDVDKFISDKKLELPGTLCTR